MLRDEGRRMRYEGGWGERGGEREKGVRVKG